MRSRASLNHLLLYIDRDEWWLFCLCQINNTFIICSFKVRLRIIISYFIVQSTPLISTIINRPYQCYFFLTKTWYQLCNTIYISTMAFASASKFFIVAIFMAILLIISSEIATAELGQAAAELPLGTTTIIHSTSFFFFFLGCHEN